QEFEVAWYGKPPPPTKTIKGLHYAPDWLSFADQQVLLSAIDGAPWSNVLRRRVQHYGYRYDYRQRSIQADMQVGPLPAWTKIIQQRLVAAGWFTASPDQMIVNEYLPGQGIAPHVDCEPCFKDTIVSISLGAPACMDFSRINTAEKRTQLLLPGSLLVLQKDARYAWQHSIPARKSDTLHGLRKPRQRRVSLTFRQVILNA
ncbi:MAG: alpha-ketoglutarate-dependent dioxygenase AlkB, partial [Bacteroidota bacterium]